MADGTVTFKVVADASDAQAELEKINRQIEKTEREIVKIDKETDKTVAKIGQINRRAERARQSFEKTDIEIQNVQASIDALESQKSPLIQQADELQRQAKGFRLAAQEYSQKRTEAGTESFEELSLTRKAEETNAQFESIAAQIDKIEKKLTPAYEKMDVLKLKATQAKAEFTVLSDQVIQGMVKIDELEKKSVDAHNEIGVLQERAGQARREIEEAASATGRLQSAADAAEKNMDKFVKRVKGLSKRVFVFTLITLALRNMREWFSKVIKTNDEALSAFARLKGALLTLAQPLVEVLIPALITFVNLLALIAGKIANFLAAIFGKTAKDSADSAEALYEQTEALEGVGGAAEDAANNLAAFDEINVLSQETTGGGGSVPEEEIAPDFSWASEVEEFMDNIAEDVLIIGLGLAAWKISQNLPGTLGTIASNLASIVLIIGGAKLAWDSLSDAWENGVDWGNFLGFLAGTAAALFGLYQLFGNVGLRFGLVTAGAAAFIVALKDMSANGVNLKNVLLAIVGQMGILIGLFGKTGLGIGLLVGGIELLVFAFQDMFANGMNLKNLFTAIAGILAAGIGIGVLTGSWFPVLLAGIASILLAITFFTGNGAQLIENLKTAFSGIVTFINGVLAGDMDKALEGLKTLFKGAFNAILTIVGSVVNLIIRGLNWLIGKINSISFTVPDWVPLIGGKTLSPNIGLVKEWPIPQLATGAVIPPNREFMAILGDQKSGTNIEAPLDTIVAAFEGVMARNSNSRGGDIVLQIDGKTFARLMNPYTQSEQKRRGVKLVTGGI